MVQFEGIGKSLRFEKVIKILNNSPEFTNQTQLNRITI